MSVKLYSNVEVAETGDPPAAHDVLGADHTVAGGAALDMVGQSAAGVLARLTPSSNPGAASRVLKSDASGKLQLAGITLEGDEPDVILNDTGTAGYTTFTFKEGGVERFALGKTSGGDFYLTVYYGGSWHNVLIVEYDTELVTFQGHVHTVGGLFPGSQLAPPSDGATRLRTFGAVGGSLVWDYSGLDGTARTILAHSAEDVVSLAYIHSVIKPSTGAAAYGTVALVPNTTTLLYNSGSDTVTLYVNTDGSITVARTGGALTYKVIVHILWL